MERLKFFVSTGNAGKLAELIPMIEEYLGSQFEVVGRPAQNAQETERTFIGNARIKTQALFNELKAEGLRDFFVLSDDSGLSVDALDGRPGVDSALYAGDHVPAIQHIEKLIGELRPLDLAPEQLSARYHCALCLWHDAPSGPQEWVAEGTCEGQIQFEIRGKAGFGFDPVFFVPELGKTFAEISYEEKNRISHRRQAFEKLKKIWDQRS